MNDIPSTHNSDFLYFITSTCSSRRLIFQDRAVKQILIDALDWYRRNHVLRLYGFVIMPNHIHLLAGLSKKKHLGIFLRNYKSLTANRISRYFDNLEDYSSTSENYHGIKNLNFSDEPVWSRGYVAKDVFSLNFLEQKLDYIHHNPCRSIYLDVETPEEYPWSSARFYLTDRSCIIPIDDVRKICG